MALEQAKRIRTKAEVALKRAKFVSDVQKTEEAMRKDIAHLANLTIEDGESFTPKEYEAIRQHNEKYYKSIKTHVDKILVLYSKISLLQWVLVEGEYEWDKPKPRKTKKRRY